MATLIQTQKHDAFTWYLRDQSSIFVGDTDLLGKLFRIRTHGEISIRYFLREADKTPVFAMVVKSLDAAYLALYHDALLYLRGRIAAHLGHPVEIIYVSPYLDGTTVAEVAHRATYSVLDHHTGEILFLTAEQLADRIAGIHAPLLASTARCVEKPINASITDAFAAWTRVFLTHECTANDLDAIRFDGDLFASAAQIIELKRPKTEPVQTWQPYTADHASYRGQRTLSSVLGWRDPRVITYTPSDLSVISAAKILKQSRDQIEYVRVLTDAKSCWLPELFGDREYLVSKR